MHVIVRILVRILDWSFAVGMGGSAAVLLLTLVEDLRTLVGH